MTHTTLIKTHVTTIKWSRRLLAAAATVFATLIVCLAAAAADYQKGQSVQVKWHDNWWPSTILEVKEKSYTIHYDGWGDEWDEDVGADRIRRPEKIQYAKAQKVQVEWKGKWYASTILEVGSGSSAGKYKIHYDGWGDEWDEWVAPNRIN